MGLSERWRPGRMLRIMVLRPPMVGRVIVVAGFLLSLTAFAVSPAAALTQTISIRPTSGSATQLITVTFVAHACDPATTGTGLLTWDGHAFGVFLPNPPSCRSTFKIVPLAGYTKPGTHRVCAGADVYSCTTYTILAPKPKPTLKPTPKPAAPTPTVSPSPSPSPIDVATPTATAVVSATPTLAPAPPTTPDASPSLDLTGAGGAGLDLVPVFIGGGIFLILLIGVVIGLVRRARTLPPPR